MSRNIKMMTNHLKIIVFSFLNTKKEIMCYTNIISGYEYPQYKKKKF